MQEPEISQMTLLLVGVGQTGRELLKRLAPHWACHCIDMNEGPLDEVRDWDVVVNTVQGDATSNLTLREAGIDEVDLVVALANSDEENYEIARLCKDQHDVPELISVVRNPDNSRKFKDLGYQVLEKSSSLATLLHNEIEKGGRVATGVGLGEGEIVEVQAMPTSRLIGRKLNDLDPRLWNVVAIYRDDELVVPHGDTEIKANDRVLLVGDPRILPSVADLLQREVAHFPLQYGERTLVLMREGDPVEQIAEEAVWIYRHSELKGIDFLDVSDRGQSSMRLEERITGLDLDFGDIPVTYEHYEGSLSDAVVEFEDRNSYGLVVLPPPESGFWTALLSTGTSLTRVSEATSKPLHISRGTLPMKDILVPVDNTAKSEIALQLGLDIGHAQEVPVTAAEVERPHFVSHEEDERWQALKRAREQGQVRKRNIDELRLTGNPVDQLVKASGDYSLLVLGVDQVEPLSYLKPVVESWLAHRAQCSVLLVGHE